MREVAIIGIGQTPVEEHWEKSLKELAGEAGLAAMADAGRESVDAVYIGNMMSGSANRQQQLGAMLADWMGLRYAEAFKLEAACGSGAAALRTGLMAVGSGAVESAVVIGVEKMTDSPSDEITSALATAMDADWEADQGLSFVALNALLMQRYMHEFGWQHTDFAAFSVNAHANGVHNPNARFRVPISAAQFNRAGMICDPIGLYDASPMGDGAAAVVLVPLEHANTRSGSSILIAGSGSATDTIALQDRRGGMVLGAAVKSVQKAYAMAGVGPADIDVFEAHDAFTIMAALSLEACGFAEQGQGPRLALDGEIIPTGRIPISTRGGLKARGHPVGATGMYQIVEVVQQLRGEADGTQVEDAQIGMAQNIGGSGSNIVTTILRRQGPQTFAL